MSAIASVPYCTAPPCPQVVSIDAASDEFNDPATLRNWSVMQGEMQDGKPGTFDIGQTSPGALTMVPSRSRWVDATRGFFVYKCPEGDLS
jgi:hypothetical protein